LVWITGIWGAWTVLLGFARDFSQVLVLSVLSGIGLAAYGGARQALIADQFPEEDRGRAFGSTYAIASVGVIGGILLLGTLAEISDIGWRIAYWLFGGLSILSGVLIWLLVEEPVRGQSEAALAGAAYELVRTMEAEHPFSFAKLLPLLRIPTVLIYWLTRIPHRLRWVGAVQFGTTWLADERGLSQGMAIYTMGMLTIGLGVGGLLAGPIGDWAYRRNPRNGRVIAGHLVTLITFIASCALFLVEWQGFLAYWILYFILGLAMEVSGAGAETPIFISAVLPEVRSTSAAASGILGSVTAIIGSYVIGQVAVRMGLTSTLLWSVVGATALHTLMWFAFYRVYHRDAGAVQLTLTRRRASLAADP
jgi:MFS family permease